MTVIALAATAAEVENCGAKDERQQAPLNNLKSSTKFQQYESWASWKEKIIETTIKGEEDPNDSNDYTGNSEGNSNSTSHPSFLYEQLSYNALCRVTNDQEEEVEEVKEEIKEEINQDSYTKITAAENGLYTIKETITNITLTSSKQSVNCHTYCQNWPPPTITSVLIDNQRW